MTPKVRRGALWLVRKRIGSVVHWSVTGLYRWNNGLQSSTYMRLA
jgi:hypothetical protein